MIKNTVSKNHSHGLLGNAVSDRFAVKRYAARPSIHSAAERRNDHVPEVMTHSYNINESKYNGKKPRHKTEKNLPREL